MSPRPLKQDNVPFYLLEHQTNSQPVVSGRLIIKRPLEEHRHYVVRWLNLVKITTTTLFGTLGSQQCNKLE